jgi:phosphatidylglycerol---prolipoprotein diacylglyceryl transferase
MPIAYVRCFLFPIHLDLGFRQFYFYEGLYFLIAIVVAYLWAARRIRANGLSEEQFTMALAAGLLGAVLCGRLSHFIFWEPGLLISNPLKFFGFWDGGISITGGLAGGIAGGALAYRKSKERFGECFAVVAPAILLGQALGRVGCFLNGDAWGIPTTLPWGVRFPKYGTILPAGLPDPRVPGFAWSWAYEQGLVAVGDSSTPPLHPTQLYESLGDLLVLGLVLLAFRKLGKGRGGLILTIYAGAYALLRFLLEFLRGDRGAVVWAGMSALQVLLAAIVALCLLGTIIFGIRETRNKL